MSVMQNIQKTDCNSFTKTRVVPGFCFAKIFPLYKYQKNTRGNEKNKMLTRIYGTAFTKKADLDAHLEHLADIKKRDHNKLGREMELFTTVDVIGQGLPLIMPNGVKMIQRMQDNSEGTKEGEKVFGY